MANATIKDKLSQIKIIKCPYMTEKMTKNIEVNNALCFIVARDAKKQDIKKSIQTVFNVKVEKINTMMDMKGKKKAIVKLKKDFNAFDIASDMGII